MVLLLVKKHWYMYVCCGDGIVETAGDQGKSPLVKSDLFPCILCQRVLTVPGSTCNMASLDKHNLLVV